MNMLLSFAVMDVMYKRGLGKHPISIARFWQAQRGSRHSHAWQDLARTVCDL